MSLEKNTNAIICPSCKRELPNDSQFCHFCGTNIEAQNLLPIEHVEKEPLNPPLSDASDYKDKESSPKTVIIGVVSVVIVILITLLIISLIGNGDKKEVSANSTTTTVTNSENSNNDTTYTVGIRTVSFSDKLTADTILELWLLGDTTEKAMTELMNEYGAEQGGGQLRIAERGDFVEEIDEWCFSPERKVGDYVIIENVYGYTLCYFSGRNLAGVPAISTTNVTWLRERFSFYYEDYSSYVLLFELLDNKEQAISASGYVDIRIVNNENVTVYSATKEFTKSDFEIWTYGETTEIYFAEICINPNEIISGNTASGKVYFKVYGDGYSFEEMPIFVSDLPVK